MSDPFPPDEFEALADAQARADEMHVMAQATPVAGVPATSGTPETDASAARGEALPHVMEALLMLVVLALVAATCWLLYAPQLRAMLRLLTQ
jgi:hypothetical protein